MTPSMQQSFMREVYTSAAWKGSDVDGKRRMLSTFMSPAASAISEEIVRGLPRDPSMSEADLQNRDAVIKMFTRQALMGGK